MGDPIAPDSLQPLAPQAPGNVLMGRFGKMTAAPSWKWWAIGGVIVVLGWWLWKRYR